MNRRFSMLPGGVLHERYQRRRALREMSEASARIVAAFVPLAVAAAQVERDFVKAFAMIEPPMMKWLEAFAQAEERAMIFKPDLAILVVRGRKTATRRLGPLRYKRGVYYALQPGRGRNHIGHVEIMNANIVPLGHLTNLEAAAEGFACVHDFETRWAEINGAYDPDAQVALYRFRYAGRRDCCAVGVAHLARSLEWVVTVRGFWT